MRVIIRDLNPAVVDAAKEAGFEDSEVGSLLLVKADALITAGNSFGIMDGGVDLSVRNYFGTFLQDRIQWEISNWKGRLPVGYALVVPSGRSEIPNVIYAPTMERPSDVRGTRNAYEAFRAAISLAKANSFQAVVCPGLCTATGRMEPSEAMAQMMEAWKNVFAPVAQR